MLKIKVIIVGDSFCGKSSILTTYKNNDFSNESFSTIGVDFIKTEIIKNNKTYNLNIWDTSGQEKFNSIINSYYRNIAVAIIVFDLSNYMSFKNLKKWIDTVYHYCNDTIIIKIVGNKSDKDYIPVTNNEIKLLCKKYNLDYLETSAKKNKNINELFESIIDNVEESIKNNKIKINSNTGITTIEEFKIEEHLINYNKKCCILL